MSYEEKKYFLSLTERQIREILWWHDSDVAKWEKRGIKEPILSMHRYNGLRKYLEGFLTDIQKDKVVSKVLNKARNEEAKR